MTTLMITRGLPASGKTTRARAWVAENPAGRARLNRDDFRLMVHEGYISRETEAVISSAQHGAARTLLLAGIDVVADDTNLKPKATLAWEEVAARAGAALVIWDLTNVPLDVCIARDAARTGNAHVGEQVIRDMHASYVAPVDAR